LDPSLLMEETVLFDISTVHFNAFHEPQWIVTVAFGILTLLTFFSFFRQILQKIIRPSWFPVQWFARVGFLLSLIPNVAFYAINHNQWQSLREAYDTGNCNQTNGIVKNLTAKEASQGPESYNVTFQVKGIQLLVENWEYLAAWEAPIRSPISDGDLVEVHYCGPEKRIAKLILYR